MTLKPLLSALSINGQYFVLLGNACPCSHGVDAIDSVVIFCFEKEGAGVDAIRAPGASLV